MNQQIQSVIRAVLMVAGAFLIGHHIWNTAIDQSVWDTIGGIVLSLVTLGWDIASKAATQDKVIGVAKQVFVFVGGLLVAKGSLTPDQLNVWVGIITTVLTTILSIIYKSKTATPSGN